MIGGLQGKAPVGMANILMNLRTRTAVPQFNRTEHKFEQGGGEGELQPPRRAVDPAGTEL